MRRIDLSWAATWPVMRPLRPEATGAPPGPTRRRSSVPVRCPWASAELWAPQTNAGVRVISLDDYTVELLRAYLAVLDEEREAFGSGYDASHSKLMRYPDGRALHADTITRLTGPPGGRSGHKHEKRPSG